MAALFIKDASKLYSAMALEGFTLKSLSVKVGVTGPYLSTVLRGKRSPSPILAKKITKALNLEMAEVFFIKESRKS